ncbi:MAG: bacteriohopanetetrol glucosamine biosynthesis glycosyltransferase HpnI [Candidatus Acidiferrales bacterium]
MPGSISGTVLRDALLVLAVIPLVYYFVAIVAAARFFRRAAASPPGANFAPSLSILKPVRGLDREAYENFASFCRQDYPRFEILFCVSDRLDPAVPVIERLILDFPQRAIRLLIGSDALGASDKVNKLCRLASEAKNQILMVTDSDVRVDPGFLRAAVAPFAGAKVGGVTCLYRGLTDGGFAANLEALGNSADFAAGVLVARLGGDINFMLGAVMAVTRPALAEIGGFESLVDFFCDDYELGNRIAARGHRVVLSDFPVAIVYPRESLAEAFRHQLRWNLSIRFSRPAGHLGLIFTQALPWAILGAALAPTRAVALGFLAAYLVCRISMAVSVGAEGLRDPLVSRHILLLPLRDAFAFLVWLASFFPQRIRWRGQQFKIRKKRLVPVSPASR